MCTMTKLTMDGHDYDLHQTRHTVTIMCSHTMEIVGTVEVSPCGEYFIAEAHDNPLGMASHHHVNSTTLEDAARSVIAGSY